MSLSHLPDVGLGSWGLERGEGRQCAATNYVTHRHSRAFLHALLHSDNTTALHHLTVHNIAYQVTWTWRGAGRALAPRAKSGEAMIGG